MMQYIVSAATAVAVALVGALSTVEFKRRHKQAERDENRAKIRMDESRLSMEMMSASIALGLAVCAAVEGKTINGEMRRAREKAVIAQEDYVRFLKEITSRQVAK